MEMEKTKKRPGEWLNIAFNHTTLNGAKLRSILNRIAPTAPEAAKINASLNDEEAERAAAMLGALCVYLHLKNGHELTIPGNDPANTTEMSAANIVDVLTEIVTDIKGLR